MGHIAMKEVFMIGYIIGTVDGVFQNSILLENNGIGYLIFTSVKSLETITGKNQTVKLFTYLHVREDELSLFGFPTTEEIDTFKLLIGVNGIGPKAALSILSVLTVRDLSMAVMAGDAKSIMKANGVGTKGANRVIMELKDKLKLEDLFITDEELSKDNMEGSVLLEKGNSVQDAVLALVSLGYSQFEALKAVKQIENGEAMDSELLLKAALKKLF